VPVKRPNYFIHQLLREQDFKDEQDYHLDMRRLHTRIFHSWGVAEGLEVRKKNNREITIEPGIAIDSKGREIVLPAHVTHDIGSFDADSHTFITISYGERMEQADHHSSGGVEGFTRITEMPEIAERRHQPAHDGLAITLARVRLDNLNQIHHIDMGPSVRKLANPVINPAAGWVRLPFKPVRLNPMKIDGRRVRISSEIEAEEFDFIVDEATAYCNERGARGSMSIPVPPGAARVVGFRIAGTTRGNVTVHLFRTGWNLKESKGEKTELLKETVRESPFHKDVHVEAPLDESHALAISVRAEGETDIWLVATKFE
jgi:hypothetical protein